MKKFGMALSLTILGALLIGARARAAGIHADAARRRARAAVAPARAETPTVARVQRQIALLDDDAYRVREAAYARLESWMDNGALSDEAMQAIANAEKSQSVEIRRAARRLRLRARWLAERPTMSETDLQKLFDEILAKSLKGPDVDISAPLLRFQAMGKGDREALADLIAQRITDEQFPALHEKALLVFEALFRDYGGGDKLKRYLRERVIAIATGQAARDIKPNVQTQKLLSLTEGL